MKSYSKYIHKSYNFKQIMKRNAGKLRRKEVVKDKCRKVKWKAGDTEFEVDKKYEYIKCIGRGAYGVVCSALNKETGEKVAIKKVPNAFEDLIDAKRIVREIKLLKFFDHENIIALSDIEKPKNRYKFEEIYIICDLMETDLHRVIYSR